MANLLLGVVLVAFVSGGCSGVRVATDYDPAADLQALNRYAWKDVERAKTGDPRVDSPFLTARIESSIERALSAKEILKAESDEADFLVDYHFAVERRLDAIEVPSGFGYRGFWGGFYGSSLRVDQYDAGTLFIDFIDRESGRLVWRGSGESRLHEYGSPEQRDIRVQRTVDAILKRFPPKR